MTDFIPQSIVVEWNKSLREGLAKRSNHHAQAKALYLLWENATDERRTNATLLESVLEQKYKIEGQSFQIPLENSLVALQMRVREFVGSFSIEPSLALIFYSGKGKIVSNRPIWIPDRGPLSDVDWFAVQDILETSSSDIALILDCAYGAVSSRNREGEGVSYFRCVTPVPTGRMEILAASNIMAEDDASFRKALLQTITNISGRQLGLNMLRREMHRLLGDALDPNYVNLSRGNTRSSITILPLERVKLDITVDKALNAGNQRALKDWADKAPSQVKTFKFLDQEHQGGNLPSQIDVVSLNDLAHESFSSWTKLAPSCVQNIKIQGSVLFSKPDNKGERLDEIIQTARTNLSMQTALTTRDGHYQNIVVFPMKWENDGFNDNGYIDQELHDLVEIFGRHFECKIEPIYNIPEEGSMMALNLKITGVVKCLTSSDLFIVIYNGHGRDTANDGGQCVLTGHGSLQVDWTWQQSLLDAAPCDVAQILDCCYAGTAIKGHILGRNEILAACDRHETTGVKVDAYIKRVTTALGALAQSAEAFSLWTLHESVQDETQRQNANRGATDQLPLPAYKLIGDTSGSITLRPRTQVAADYKRFVELSEDFLGYGWARLPIRDRDLQSWQISGVAELFTSDELLKEIQNETRKI